MNIQFLKDLVSDVRGCSVIDLLHYDVVRGNGHQQKIRDCFLYLSSLPCLTKEHRDYIEKIWPQMVFFGGEGVSEWLQKSDIWPLIEEMFLYGPPCHPYRTYGSSLPVFVILAENRSSVWNELFAQLNLKDWQMIIEGIKKGFVYQKSNYSHNVDPVQDELDAQNIQSLEDIYINLVGGAYKYMQSVTTNTVGIFCAVFDQSDFKIMHNLSKQLWVKNDIVLVEKLNDKITNAVLTFDDLELNSVDPNPCVTEEQIHTTIINTVCHISSKNPNVPKLEAMWLTLSKEIQNKQTIAYYTRKAQTEDYNFMWGFHRALNDFSMFDDGLVLNFLLSLDEEDMINVLGNENKARLNSVYERHILMSAVDCDKESRGSKKI